MVRNVGRTLDVHDSDESSEEFRYGLWCRYEGL
jgi:hypothetical protein